jgi:hypothetical protein
VEVNNNTLEDNSTSNSGGGLLLLGYVTATGNTLTDNSAHSGGGISGVVTGTLQDNRFIGNTAQVGGGLKVGPWGLNLIRNYYRGNMATNGDGGAIHLYSSFTFDATLEGERIVQNSATGKGGGIYMRSDESDSETTFTNVLIQENTAPTGSGIYKLGDLTTFEHCTIAGNRADGADGVGLYSKELFSGGFTMLNSIVAGQDTGIYVHSGAANIDGILWGDGPWDNGADWNTAPSTANELWGDPRFVPTDGEGYHIDKTSEARDAATDIGVTVDMDQQVRPYADTGIPDLGADEWSGDFDFLLFSDGFESGNTSAWSRTVK